jgi:MazG family protein
MVQQLLYIMERLRDPDHGCPWDQEQDFSTIAPYTLEEAYEVADAIARNEPGDLCDELGDLLFQVVFHAQMAKERGWFCFDDVVDSINRKMIRRHPHVFADAQVENAQEQTRVWEHHKAEERAAKGGAGASALDGVPVALPALVRAQKLQHRAARVGFDWTEISDVIDKLEEELKELKQALQDAEPPGRVQEELGDILFSGVNLARFLEADAESVLRSATRKFDQRFRLVELKAKEEGKSLSDCSLDELEAYWQQAKAGLDNAG